MQIFMQVITLLIQGPLACFPVPYRTNAERPAMQLLLDEVSGIYNTLLIRMDHYF